MAPVGRSATWKPLVSTDGKPVATHTLEYHRAKLTGYRALAPVQ